MTKTILRNINFRKKKNCRQNITSASGVQTYFKWCHYCKLINKNTKCSSYSYTLQFVTVLVFLVSLKLLWVTIKLFATSHPFFEGFSYIVRQMIRSLVLIYNLFHWYTNIDVQTKAFFRFSFDKNGHFFDLFVFIVRKMFHIMLIDL